MSIPPISSPNPAEQRSLAQTGGFDDSAWTGWIAFAGVIMVMLGFFHAIQGLVAIFKDQYYLVGTSGLIVNVNYTTWGWVHLLGGIILAAAGFCVFTGMIWARIVGVILAMASAIVNVGFLAAYPIWSLMMIALDVVIILALTVHGSEMKQK